MGDVVLIYGNDQLWHFQEVAGALARLRVSSEAPGRRAKAVRMLRGTRNSPTSLSNEPRWRVDGEVVLRFTPECVPRFSSLGSCPTPNHRYSTGRGAKLAELLSSITQFSEIQGLQETGPCGKGSASESTASWRRRKRPQKVLYSCKI